MKKNKALRIGSCLAVVALLSTCLVAGTFAKYTTSGDSTDTARVAKWGVTVAGTNNSMFKTTYDGTVVAQANDDGTTDNVVAPGTKGELTAVVLSGKPEVNVKVTNDATVSLTGWTVDTNTYYCPLEVKVGDTTLKGSDYTSATLFEDAIEGAVNDTTATYAAGTDLATDGCPNISWEWKYEGNSDANDTKLGDAHNAKFNISVTTTVTQVD